MRGLCCECDGLTVFHRGLCDKPRCSACAGLHLEKHVIDGGNVKNTYCVECGSSTRGVCEKCKYPVCWLCAGLHIEKEHITMKVQSYEREEIMAPKNSNNDDLTANGPWSSETINELKSRVDEVIRQAQAVVNEFSHPVYQENGFTQGVVAQARVTLEALTGWGETK